MLTGEPPPVGVATMGLAIVSSKSTILSTAASPMRICVDVVEGGGGGGGGGVLEPPPQPIIDRPRTRMAQADKILTFVNANLRDLDMVASLVERSADDTMPAV